MKEKSKILFADAVVESLEPSKTLPAKFNRLLKRLQLSKRVRDKKVAIKMHFGGNIGFTTIHPIFIRILVAELKAAGAKSIKIMDGSDPADGIPRGLTPEVLGCEMVCCFGKDGKNLRKERIDYKTLDQVEYGGEALDCDVFIDFAHVKGHGACGFGGALKNIGMGMIPPSSRGKIHGLEGGLTLDKEKCIFCLKCFNECKNHAINANKEKKEIRFFFHNCTFCQHCILICPQKAIQMENRKFDDFSRGMSLVASKFLKKFNPENLLFINILTNITIYCDCWGMSTPSLVPDIGILASDDIVAIDTASLDLIKAENLLPSGLPKDRELMEGKHLFEKLHGKNPYLMVQYLAEDYGGSSEYELAEVK